MTLYRRGGVADPITTNTRTFIQQFTTIDPAITPGWAMCGSSRQATRGQLPSATQERPEIVTLAEMGVNSTPQTTVFCPIVSSTATMIRRARRRLNVPGALQIQQREIPLQRIIRLVPDHLRIEAIDSLRVFDVVSPTEGLRDRFRIFVGIDPDDVEVRVHRPVGNGLLR